MEKAIIIGCPGSGKSTFGRRLKLITGLPLYHLDNMFWNMDKTTVSKDVFIRRLREVMSRPKWIIDGNYGSSMEMRLKECDTIFFLDYPAEVCLDGVEKRKGQPRSDIPWTEDGDDEEFIDFIRKFNTESRREILRLLEKYSSKSIVVFHTREESEEYLSELKTAGFLADKERRNMLGNIFILGDSYSTFEGYNPDGYGTYYHPDGPNYLRKYPEMVLTDKDVTSVEQTWWYNLVKENGNLLLNCSWSGTTICNTGYDGADFSKISFIARFEQLLKDGFFEENHVDTFFLFGGTNDSWSDAPLGNAVYSDWTSGDLYNVLPAFSYLINRMVSALPDTKIYCIINSDLKKEITDYYRTVCNENGVNTIELCDIEKVHGHPTIEGMHRIKEQVLDCIKSNKEK